MSESEEIARLVGIIRQVPAKQLKLVEIARQVTGTDGKVAFKKVQALQADINLAQAEARAYSRATYQTREALEKLTARLPEVIV